MNIKNNTWEQLPLILDTQMVAHILCCKATTIRRWAREGTLPSRKLGKQYLFDREAIMHRLKGVEED